MQRDLRDPAARADATGTRVYLYFGVVPRGALGGGGDPPRLPDDRARLRPRAARARRSSSIALRPDVLQLPPPPLLGRGRSAAARAARRSSSPKGCPPTCVDKLVDWIRTGDDADLHRIQIRERARAWKLPEIDMLRTALHATRAGLLDAVVGHGLPALPRRARRERQARRRSQAEAHCEVVPGRLHDRHAGGRRGHVPRAPVDPRRPRAAVLQRRAGEEGAHPRAAHASRRASTADVDAAARARPLHRVGRPPRRLVPRRRRRRPAERRVRAITPRARSCSATPDADGRRSRTTARRPSCSRSSARRGATTRCARACCSSFQEFRDLFSEDYIGADVKLAVGEQTLLFTDVVGSTAFYASRGDPAAFVEIKKHFDEVFAIVAKNRGAVVKTIGDAVMATFVNPVDAVRASQQIHNAFHPDARPTRRSGCASRSTPGRASRCASTRTPTSSAAPSTSPPSCRRSPRAIRSR